MDRNLKRRIPTYESDDDLLGICMPLDVVQAFKSDAHQNIIIRNVGERLLAENEEVRWRAGAVTEFGREITERRYEAPFRGPEFVEPEKH